MSQQWPIGCLTVIWIASGMKFDEAIRSQKDAVIAAARLSKNLIQLCAETSASWRDGQPDRVEQVSGIAIAPKGWWSRLITSHLTTRSSYTKVAR
jgi:hypothetical protein